MSKKAPKRGIGDELLQSIQEALDHARGREVAVRRTEVDTLAVEVKRIRKKVRLSQDAFAEVLGVSASGLRKWEQGQRRPSGAALTLLQIMDREPEAVIRAIKHDQ